MSLLVAPKARTPPRNLATTRSNPGSSPGQADAYAWQAHYQVARAYTTNGLNRYSQAVAGGATATYGYDANGNLITAPGPVAGQTIAYAYDEGLLRITVTVH